MIRSEIIAGSCHKGGNEPLDARLVNSLKGGPSFPLKHRFLRLCWILVWASLASWTPPQFRGWRALLLRCFGAKIGVRADVRGSARVWYPPNLSMEQDSLLAEGVICYNMASVTLKAGAMVSQRAHLCGGSHDIDDAMFQLVVRPIYIGMKAWIASEAFIGPGVNVGDYAVVGARAVVMRDIAPRAIAIGNPARAIARKRQIIHDGVAN